MKNKSPIAILLAVYNGDKFLVEQIESIIAQTNKNWVLYIRNDASTDKTGEIIEQYCNLYPEIKEVKDSSGNLGCRGNFFRLLKEIESAYYMFSDADDVWLPNKVALSYERMLEMERNFSDKPIIVHTDCSVVDTNLNMIYPEYWKATHFTPEAFYGYNLLSIRNPVAGAVMTINHKVKDLVFPLANNTILHDRWISMIVAKEQGVFSAIHTPTLLYRQHGNNIYGIDVIKKKSRKQKLIDLYRLNLFVAKKLKGAGYGSFFKYIFYKIIIIIKLRLSK